MALSAPTLRRLAFIKFLFLQAQQQARLPDLRASAALLTFHDAVEMFLQLGCEHRSAALPSKPTFEQYWKPLASALGVTALPEALAMKRLNAARVGLKHQGLIPSAVDIEGYHVTVTAFFSSATPDVFGVDFDRISMVDFVQPEECRDLLVEAGRLSKSGDQRMAAVKVLQAFNKMISHYATDPAGRTHAVYDFRSQLSMEMWRLGNQPHPSRDERAQRAVRDAFRELERALSTALEPMQYALLILGLGLDFRRYAKFKGLMPDVYYTEAGTIAQIVGGDRLDKQDIETAVNFVIDSAIVLGSPA